MTSHARPQGFTLLEAIVAVAILGIALIPLLSFISQMSLELRTAGDSNARSLAEQNVLAFIEPVNPMEQPEGQADLGDLHIAWTSRPVVPETDTGPGSGIPVYRFGFYDVTVQVSRNQAPWFDFVARKVGFHSNTSDFM